MEAVISSTCKQVTQHISCCGISASVPLSTSDKKQSFCNMALPSTGVSRNHKPLLTFYKVELCKFHYLDFVHPGLENEVEVRK